MGATEVVSVGDAPLPLERLVAVARDGAELRLSSVVPERMQQGVSLLGRLLERGESIYGVTTGVGDSHSVAVAPLDRAALALNLMRFHGCGTGALFSVVESRAITVARIVSLARGHSGVRSELLQRWVELLNRGVVAAIPSEGSVGASGDLTPLSYLASVLAGEREVWFQGEVRSARDVFERLGVQPIELRPKESLSLMNGTSAMTGLAALCWYDALRLCRWACALTACVCDATLGHASHFDELLDRLKPHPGQVAAAGWIRADLGRVTASSSPHLQDRYSLRCAPHILGVALDQLEVSRSWLEVELNSVNDNPVLDLEGERLLHGGHFYGGHVCQAMDCLKIAIANLADLLDRQLLLLCHPATSHGLSVNLVAAAEPSVHHGFKAMQITASALAAEALKHAMPASVFSRSTENHNQDKVSLGTIAARDCRRVIELVEQVAAVATVAGVQAIELRGLSEVGPRARSLHEAVRREVSFNQADRRMDVDIAAVLRSFRGGSLPVGELDAARLGVSYEDE